MGDEATKAAILALEKLDRESLLERAKGAVNEIAKLRVQAQKREARLVKVKEDARRYVREIVSRYEGRVEELTAANEALQGGGGRSNPGGGVESGDAGSDTTPLDSASAGARGDLPSGSPVGARGMSGPADTPLKGAKALLSPSSGDVDAVDVEVVELRKKVDRLEKELSASEERRSKEVSVLRSGVETRLRVEIGRVESEAEKSREMAVHEAREEGRRLVEEERRRREKVEKEMEQVMQREKELVEKLEEREKRLRGVEKEGEERDEKWGREVEDMRRELEQRGKEREKELLGQVRNQETRCEELRQEMAEMETRMKELEGGKEREKDMAGKLLEATRRSEKYVEQISSLEREVERLKRDTSHLAEEKVTELEERVRTEKRRKEEVEEEREAAEERCRLAVTATEHAEEKAEGLERRMKELQSETDEWKRRCKDAEHRLEEATKETELRIRTAERKAAEEATLKERKTTEETVASAKREAASHREKRALARKEVVSLAKQRDDAKAQNRLFLHSLASSVLPDLLDLADRWNSDDPRRGEWAETAARWQRLTSTDDATIDPAETEAMLEAIVWATKQGHRFLRERDAALTAPSTSTANRTSASRRSIDQHSRLTAAAIQSSNANPCLASLAACCLSISDAASAAATSLVATRAGGPNGPYARVDDEQHNPTQDKDDSYDVEIDDL